MQLQACRIRWGFPTTKNSSERSLDSALRYRIHIRASPIAKLPTNPLLPLFSNPPTPKNRSRDLSTSGPGWRFTLGRNSICSVRCRAKLETETFPSPGDWCSSPPKGRKNIWISPWILRTKLWFLVFFFFLWRGMLWIRKNQHPQKNASNFNQNRLGSRWFFPTSPGRLPRDDLVRVWATCPPEKVPEMDVAMSKAGE